MAMTRKEIDKRYYHKNKEKRKENVVKWRNNNRDKRNAYCREWNRKVLAQWSELFPDSVNCEICGKLITFNSGDIRTSICFDHKSEDVPIKKAPANWMKSKTKTPKNEALFKSCNFGLLCNECNIGLPTENRIEWLEKALKYAKN